MVDTIASVRVKSKGIGWILLHYFFPRFRNFPESLGTLDPLTGTLYMDACGTAAYRAANPHKKYCFDLYVAEWNLLRRSTQAFTLQWILNPFFRLRVRKAGVFRILCGHVLRHGSVPHMYRVDLVDFLLEGSKGTFAKREILRDWVDLTTYMIRRTLRDHGKETLLHLRLDLSGKVTAGFP